MGFALRFTPGAVADLDGLRAFDRRRILQQIRQVLVPDPLTLGARKKIVVSDEASVRQFRVGDFRVFYDILEDEIHILGVRRKGRRTTGEIL